MESTYSKFYFCAVLVCAEFIIGSSLAAGSNLTTQTAEIAPGITYEFVHIKAENGKPTLLFLHGFPSSLHAWRHQIKHFSSQGYGCLAPNLMGYGKTYSPLDYNQYSSRNIIKHLLALLNHVGLNQSRVFVIGHDWGARTASRFVLYHPERTIGAVLLSVAYSPPVAFNLTSALSQSLQAFNYTSIGYWTFFDANDAASMIESHVDSFIDLLFANNSSLARTDLAPVGKVREWLSQNKRTNRAAYMSKEDYDTVRSYLASGMQQKLNWFKVLINNVDFNYERNLNATVQRPVLFIEGKADHIGIIGAGERQRNYTSNLKIVRLDTGHWVMEEKPDDVNREIDQWITTNSASKLCLYFSFCFLSLFFHVASLR